MNDGGLIWISRSTSYAKCANLIILYKRSTLHICCRVKCLWCVKVAVLSNVNLLKPVRGKPSIVRRWRNMIVWKKILCFGRHTTRPSLVTHRRARTWHHSYLILDQDNFLKNLVRNPRSNWPAGIRKPVLTSVYLIFIQSIIGSCNISMGRYGLTIYQHESLRALRKT